MERGRPATAVATCTVQAVHRRDHDHSRHEDCCHPHAVEVVHLGRHALVACHDCGTDSGFVPGRDAERIAGEHRKETRAGSVPLPRAAGF